TIKRNGAGTIAARGALDFARTGTTLFTRLNGHTIDHSVITILSGTTLEVISGDVQLASYVEEFAGQNLPMLYVSSGATFTLRNNSSVYTTGNFLKSTVQGASGSRIRIQHTNGFYSGFSSAAINSSGNMGFILSATGTVEYFGDDNQIVTGIGMGNAVGGNQKYGILEINFGGTPNTEYVYPTNNGTVNVRNQLKLTNGELRLDEDNDPTVGGRTIIIENSPNTSISRTNGYIRAETYDGASIVKWMFGADNTPHTIPFGINSTTYIPLTVTSTGGNAGFVSTSTFETNPANLPFPPGVGHVNSAATGADNSADCVDRFWKINQSGSSTTFNAVFSAPVAEFPAIAGTYKAQHYNYAGGFWDNPFQGAQSYNAVGAVRSVTVTGLSTANDWWVLVNQNTPLPVELLSFDANCINNRHQIKWTTASELNNDFFTIEKSSNGNEFTFFRKIQGSGTINDTKTYTVSAEDGIAEYYKLKQFDFNGTMHELKTIYAPSCQNDMFKLLSVNQVEEVVNSIISSPDNVKAEITLFDLKGILVFKEEVSLTTGINSVRLPINLAKGLYYFQIINDNQVTQGRKFLVN
ncbi:MAG TPA: T9SS type A sorting domain-containing protein, partial [Bacteroidia bacterium]|nr:T9SS type A sorting domain-containing protein [Bacteroidia bacterium]